MNTRKDRPLQVLSAASEVFPLIKTGGLADVVGALPHALAPHDIFIRTLIPGYPAVFQHLEDAEPVWRDTNFFGGDTILIRARAGGLDLFILDAPHLFARPGNPYLAPNGTDWPDNPIRFAALSYAAALLCQGIVPDYKPSILHVHDWQTGLAPAYLHVVSGPKPASIITVHNLAFQGLAPASLLETLALPAAMFAPGGVEYYGSIGALKAGLRYADRITTVSPSYAAEILTAEGGMGLHGLLQERAPDVFGILNGVDTKIWDPQTDLLIPAPYSAATLAARTRNKAALQAQFGLPQQSSTIVFGVVSRLSDQKGLDILLACLPDLLAMDAQLVVLGAGDTSLQAAFADAAIRHPAQIGTIIGYSEPLAHLIQAGSDALLVPSRFEPCGLTQLCALRYGAIPIVSRVGGLADTIIDANEAALNAGVANGLQFNPVTRDGLAGALHRAQRLWQQPKAWAKMQKNAMATDVSWTNPAQRYADLYRSLA